MPYCSNKNRIIFTLKQRQLIVFPANVLDILHFDLPMKRIKKYIFEKCDIYCYFLKEDGSGKSFDLFLG